MRTVYGAITRGFDTRRILQDLRRTTTSPVTAVERDAGRRLLDYRTRR